MSTTLLLGGTPAGGETTGVGWLVVSGTEKFALPASWQPPKLGLGYALAGAPPTAITAATMPPTPSALFTAASPARCLTGAEGRQTRTGCQERGSRERVKGPILVLPNGLTTAGAAAAMAAPTSCTSSYRARSGRGISIGE